MLWISAGFLLTVGFGTWVAGSLFQYTGVAVIGATIILGVGVVVAGSGLEYQSGRVESVNESTNTTTVSYQYSQVQLPADLPIGFLILLVGASLGLRSLDEAS